MESIILHSNKSDFTVEFNQPLDLRGGKYMLALKHVSLWNSWHNISEKYKIINFISVQLTHN